jgi:formate-dependent nitrite reductase membrane component NrfD
MQCSWHLVVIIAAILIGACLFQMSETNANMTSDQAKQATMYRNWAYALWVLAAVMVVYYYMMQGGAQKARMCGGGYQQAYMCGAKHSAQMGRGMPRRY